MLNIIIFIDKIGNVPNLLPRKRWLRPDMTEKLLTGTLSLNTTNQPNLLFDMAQNQILTYIFKTSMVTVKWQYPKNYKIWYLLWYFHLVFIHSMSNWGRTSKLDTYMQISAWQHTISPAEVEICPHLNEGWGILVWIWITLTSALACLVACMIFY